MSFSMNEEQILNLAPDAASVKAAKSQLKPAKWSDLGITDRALFGCCKGSGKNPYKTVIDTENLAYKCSCPSRKFPCKHALALMLLYASDQSPFTLKDEPEFVKEWLDKREATARKKEEKAAQTAAAPVDEKARAKRLAARNKKVQDGIDDLQLLLRDIVRTGLLNSSSKLGKQLRDMSKRMVDAQATGLSVMLSDAARDEIVDADDKTRLLRSLSRIYLLCEAYRNLDAQSEDMREEIKSRIGFAQSKEEVLATAPVTGRFLCLGRTAVQRQSLVSECHYLYSFTLARFLYALNFYPKNMPQALILPPGSVISGSLHLFAGAGMIRRALVADSKIECAATSVDPDICSADLSEALTTVKNAFAQNPFLKEVPVLIRDVNLVKTKDSFVLLDAAGKTFDAVCELTLYHKIMGMTCGESCTLFVLADPFCMRVTGAAYKEEYLSDGSI